MKNNQYNINLDLPPRERWHFLTDLTAEVNELLQCYLHDLSAAGFIQESIGEHSRAVVPSEYLEEIEFISSISDFTPNQVLTANLYYDLLKFYFGCTAFAVSIEEKVLHARNLDWHTDNNLLSRHSKIFNFQREGKTVFRTVGWPGFNGALSGLRPGGFAITLNAVLSEDSPQIAFPISFLLREVLDKATSFQEAQKQLESSTIACDCLLLLSGIHPTEKVVIERTPTRFATRGTSDQHIIVTNDYKELQNNISGDSILQSTSCGRYDRANELLHNQPPTNAKACLGILQDENVMMNITVQQMIFDNRTGEILLVKTGD